MKKFLSALFILFSLCSHALAAGTYDGVASASTVLTDTCSTNPTSFNVTQTNTNEPAVFVSVTYVGISGLVVDEGAPHPGSVTANGNDMAYVGEVVNGTHITEFYSYRGLTGTITIQVNWEDDDDLCVMTAYTRAITAYNVQQTGSYIYQVGTATGSSSPITRTITSNNANNLLIDSAEAHAGYVTISVTGSGQTQRFNNQVGGKGGYMRVGNSTKQATAGSDTMSWSESINRVWGQIVIEVIGTAGASTARLLPLLGVGQ